MEKLSFVICVDVEPEERAIDPKVTADWIGFEKTFEFFEELRPRLGDATGAPVHFSWFLRMDPQIAQVYGNPAWAVARYDRLLDRLQASGDEIGLHVHAWRWDRASSNWIADMGNQKWVDHSVRMSFAAFEQSFNRPCLSFRFGDRWLDNETLDLVERLGGRFELTLEPGRTKLIVPEDHTGVISDWSLVPRRPYHPSKADFTNCSDSNSRQFWAVPLSTFNPDQVLGPLSVDGEPYRETSFLQKLKRRIAVGDNCWEGFLDRADYQAILGWAFDAGQPDRPLEVEIYDGQVMLARVTADGFRQDLRLAKKGDGRHGFALPTPTCLRDDKPHFIRARVANTLFDLKGSPRPIDSAPLPLVEVDVLLLDLGGEPWLASQIIALAHGAPGMRYLATSLRSHEISIPVRRANLHETFANILNHPQAKDFVFQTPAELVARIE